MPASLQNIYTMVKHHYVKRTFKPYVIHREISGMQFELYIADPVGKEWYDVNSSEWIEMEYLKDNLITPGETILECGAHHGVTTTYIAKCAGPKGHVVAFEPSPSNVSVIRKNLKLNKLTNAKAINKAIGEAPGKANFSFFSNASLQSGSLGTYPVDVTTIDEYANLKPTMLKLDVEGYEVEALRGAKKVLKTRPKLAIEIHTHNLAAYGHTVQEVFDQLDLSTYKCTIMGAGNKFGPLGDITDITTNVHLFAVPK